MTTFDENTLKPLRASLLLREGVLLGEITAARDADSAAASATGTAITDVNDFKNQAMRQRRTKVRYAETQRDRDDLADLRAALARLKAGTYRICIDCAKPVDLARLTAIPAAACHTTRMHWHDDQASHRLAGP